MRRSLVVGLLCSALCLAMASVAPDLDPGERKPPECGNDLKESGEVCDGPDLGGLSCEFLGAGTGSLGCLADCSDVDRSGCSLLVDAGADRDAAAGDAAATDATGLEAWPHDVGDVFDSSPPDGAAVEAHCEAGLLVHPSESGPQSVSCTSAGASFVCGRSATGDIGCVGQHGAACYDDADCLEGLRCVDNRCG